MQKGFLPSLLFASLFSLVALQGCKKDNGLGVDNDKVVKTPYSLYAANSEGWLVNTTDGILYSGIFPPDGYAPSLLISSGNNILMLKENLHMSTNNGRNFNPVFSNAKKFPWQTMAYDFLAHNRIYITSNAERGVSYSQDNGQTWVDDADWSDNVPGSPGISSFSGLGNGVLFAYGHESNTLLRKDNQGAQWSAVAVQTDVAVAGSAYFLSSNNNVLFLTDRNGIGGVWFSEDEGVNWTQFDQGDLPGNHGWNCAASPNGGQTFLVGTDSMGVYRSDNGKMISATVGLEKNTTVYSMAVKRNMFKDNIVRTYVFIATNIGIYRSEDNGQTWFKMTEGAFDGKYVAVY